MLGSLDQSKDFDLMHTTFYLTRFKIFGLGQGFLKCVEIVFKSCRSQVEANGFITCPFQVMRG